LNLDFSLISSSENISDKKISFNNETHNTLTDMKKIEKLQIHNQINTHLTKFKSGENKDSSLTRVFILNKILECIRDKRQSK